MKTIDSLAEDINQVINYSKEFLDYNPVTGLLIWKKPPSRFIKAGQEAGHKGPDGIMIKIMGRAMPAHRLIWIMVFNEDPPEQIDHKDRNCYNNSLDNLRASCKFTNQQNTIARKDSSTGVKGVSPVGSKFRARSSLYGKRVCLGTFSSEEDAKEVLMDFRRKHYGEFSNG